MERSGQLYRTLRERLGERAEVEFVDPRNQITLFPMLIRDIRRYRRGWRTLWQALFGLRIPSVFADGRLVTAGRLPDPAEVLDAIT